MDTEAKCDQQGRRYRYLRQLGPGAGRARGDGDGRSSNTFYTLKLHDQVDEKIRETFAANGTKLAAIEHNDSALPYVADMLATGKTFN